MSTRSAKFVLYLAVAALFSPAPARSGPVRAAVVPAENRTGDTGLDYLGDLFFHVLVGELSRCRGLELYERGRADLIFRERRLSPEMLSSARSSAPVDLVVGGAFFPAEQGEGKVVELSVLWLNQTGFEAVSRREISSFRLETLIPAVEELVREGLVRPNGWEQEEPARREVPIGGKKVAVIGFNNYSSRSEYDPLQKGIVFLFEERLRRNPALEILEREKLKEIFRELDLGGALGGEKPGFCPAAADLLVSGYFAFAGNEFLLAARVIEVPSTRIAGFFRRRAPEGRVAETVRDLVEEVGESLSGLRSGEDLAAGIYPATSEALLYYARGAELYDRGEYLAAVENINRAVSVDPGYVFGSWEAARIYEENLGLYDRAAEAYEKVLAGRPDRVIREKTMLRLGMLFYRRLRDFSAAARYFERFLEEFPDSDYRDAVLNALGAVWQQRGEYAQAREIYRQALESPGFNPLRGSLLVRAGQCSYQLEEFDRAREYFRLARDEHGGDIYRSEAGAREVTVGEEARKYLSRLE